MSAITKRHDCTTCVCGKHISKHKLVDGKLVAEGCKSYRCDPKVIDMSTETKSKKKVTKTTNGKNGKPASKKVSVKKKSDLPECPICKTNEKVAKAGTVSPTNKQQRFVCRQEHKAQGIKMKYFWEKAEEKKEA